ncbi:MAG: 5'-methylthioadenosine/adenosylhomocysteine nucleosidase [Clostridium argentinense]|nr:5'-methylthioadenosine/adenosylhomocysteine nucleosidase [Clostridium argentinense]
MKTIGIIGAMDLEIELIKNNITILKEEIYAGFKFYIGAFKNVNLVLTSCSIGKVNAAACTQILIDKFRVTSIINTGIAGGLNDEVKICDIVISNNVTYHDVCKEQMKGWFPFVEYFETSNLLVEVAVQAYKNLEIKEFNYHIGRIVTGEAFISDNEAKINIIKNYSPHCVEMEGSAIGHVAYINKIPFIVIRSISDNADNDAHTNYENFEKISANNSSKLVLNMLKIINDRAD